MTTCFEEPTYPELAGDRAEELAGDEVNAFRTRDRLAVGVALQCRDRVPRVGGWVSRHWVRVQNADNLDHGSGPFAGLSTGRTCASVSSTYAPAYGRVQEVGVTAQ